MFFCRMTYTLRNMRYQRYLFFKVQVLTLFAIYVIMATNKFDSHIIAQVSKYVNSKIKKVYQIIMEAYHVGLFL